MWWITDIIGFSSRKHKLLTYCRPVTKILTIRGKGKGHVGARPYLMMGTVMLPVLKLITLFDFLIRNVHYELRKQSKTQNGVKGPGFWTFPICCGQFGHNSVFQSEVLPLLWKLFAFFTSFWLPTVGTCRLGRLILLSLATSIGNIENSTPLHFGLRHAISLSQAPRSVL